MFRKIFIILLFISAKCAMAQKSKENFDVLNYKHTVSQQDQVQTFYVSSGEKKVKVINDRFYHWYSKNKLVVTQGGYEGKLLNGPYVVTFPNKNIKEKGVFKDGLKTGEWKKWLENGNLNSLHHYKKGIYQGKYIEYDPNGIIIGVGNYRNGNLHGNVSTRVSPDSLDTRKYKNGKVIKPFKINDLAKRFFKKKDSMDVTIKKNKL